MGTEELMLRLEGLEQRQRWLVRLCAIALALIAGPLMMAAGKAKTEKVLEADKLVIRDAKGAVRVALATAADGSASLELFDGQGGKVMSLRGPTAAPIIELADGSGGSAWITASATGSSLSLSKGNGEVEVAANASGAPSVRLQNRDGKVLWHAP